MLLGALDHPKMYALAERLAVTRPQAIGHMELLWAFTSTKAPAGDIGKWPLTAVAQACDWFGDPAVFLAGLVAAGFVDEHPVHKYVIHDWHEHCPRFVRARVKALSTGFASMAPLQSATTVSTAGGDSSRRLQGGTADPLSMPRHATPRHATHSEPGLQTPTAVRHTPEWDFAGKVPPDPDANGAAPPAGYPDDGKLMDAFATIRSLYPARSGRAHDWLLGERAWRQRLDEGTAIAALQSGVERYAAYVAGGGVSSPAYVLGIDKFFGANDQPWAQPWTLPAKADERIAGNISAAEDWLRGGQT